MKCEKFGRELKTSLYLVARAVTEPHQMLKEFP